jgi:FAD/FMN-containing dehydrogenase/Fe-S oxidoreductase
MNQVEAYHQLKEKLSGDLFTENVQRVIYATDASSYREIPEAVCKPKNKEDIREIIRFARENGTSIIPRAAGTSLAGQVVGPGIVVDISKYMNKILEFNKEEHWIWVEPGVNLAELNQFLAPHGLQFGPETSTANRCCIGGMVGNNSCGLHSLVYGSARDHLLEAECILSDGTTATFKALTTEEFQAKCEADHNLLETRIYQNIYETLASAYNQEQIRKEFPDPKVKRRNNGYAIDVLLETDPFTGNGEKLNICKLLAGSEGTLAFSTRLKLNLIPLPPSHRGLLCAHFASLKEAYRGNLIALKHLPTAVELMDDIIMNCTGENIEQRKNRFFISGNPAAMLMIEFACETLEELLQKAANLEADCRIEGVGYHFPLVQGDENIKKVWALRTAGLGVLSNIPGDKRSTTVIEDTALAPEYLPDYMEELDLILGKYGLSCVKYAHIATGEIHLRPLLNLKDERDIERYHTIAREIAALVKKYRGSLSGEHGDGRLRGEFIPFMLGEHNYKLIKKLKKTWDPDNILNPGKIIDTPPITENLRFIVGQQRTFQTTLEFNMGENLLQAIERCNGSADCRKSVLIGGTMCPTFMATKDEDKTTRARANVLREFLTRSDKANPFDQEEIYRVMDLCLSCKACKAECPSNIDMAKFKAEFLQHYYESHTIPLRTRLIAWMPKLYRWGRKFRPLTNAVSNATWFKKMIGFAPERQVPLLAKESLRKWYRKPTKPNGQSIGKVYLFADEFTNENESGIGIKAILLLNKLGYEVVIPKHRESGRTFLSKGMVKTAQKVARDNVEMLAGLISAKTPLLGIEPSALLTFRDEYPDLLAGDLKEKAKELAKNSLLIDEFLAQQDEKGKIDKHRFTFNKADIKLHGHCQQKAIASTAPTRRMLEIPSNYKVSEIKSGCCGMAGSFGYEKEHYELSMKIGEMILFPAVREASPREIIAAPGTSCRHHILEGTGREALHPIEILYNALK